MNNAFFRLAADIRVRVTIDRAIVVRRVKVKNGHVIEPRGLVTEKPPPFGRPSASWS